MSIAEVDELGVGVGSGGEDGLAEDGVGGVEVGGVVGLGVGVWVVGGVGEGVVASVELVVDLDDVEGLVIGLIVAFAGAEEAGVLWP